MNLSPWFTSTDRWSMYFCRRNVNMKSILATAIFFAATMIGSHAQTTTPAIVCPVTAAEFCLAEPPPCAVNEALSGVDGCWRCCRIIHPIICPYAACTLERPICLDDEVLTGTEGCWGCCYPIALANWIIPTIRILCFEFNMQYGLWVKKFGIWEFDAQPTQALLECQARTGA